MKRVFFIAIGILLFETAQLSAQVEFIDQAGIGFGYGFVEDKEYSGANTLASYLLGIHIHNWNTAILVGGGLLWNKDKGTDFNLGGQVEHYFNYLNSRRLTGYGASLGGGVKSYSQPPEVGSSYNRVSSFSDEIIPYIRPGVFWHYGTMIKLALELEYCFNGQISAGIMFSLPLLTVSSRMYKFKDIYLERE
jgi:hypothetical protein